MVKEHPGHFLRGLRAYGGMDIHSAETPGEEPGERVAWGMTRPIIALRLLLANRDLLRAALIPPFCLAVACAAFALLKAHGAGSFVKRFYLTFAALAPLPSLIFARHYARFAARVRMRFGFGECKPRIEPLGTSIRRVIHGFIMLSIAPVVLFVPVAIFIGITPLPRRTFTLLSAAITAVWALHWIVVDALDNAQVVIPGRSPPAAPAPWFVHMLRRVRFASRIFDRYSKFWREEIEIIERHRAIALGFGLATAALLATPVLNLFFRPITIAAAVQLSAALEKPDQHPEHDSDTDSMSRESPS